MKKTAQIEIPIQPVESPVICAPYEEPKDHWFYDKETGIATRAGTRRDAGYWYKTERVGTGQKALFLEERIAGLTPWLSGVSQKSAAGIYTPATNCFYRSPLDHSSH